MKLPEPRKVEIEIFGEKAFLQERTAQERYLIEGAFNSQNGDTSLYGILAIQSLVFALACNIKPGFWNWRRNAKFRRRNLKKQLRMSQIEFLIEQINRLEQGDDYDEKKKSQAGIKSTGKPSGD